jgi:hypothetical protein
VTEPLVVDLNTTVTRSSEEELRTDPDSHSWRFVTERVPRRVPLFMPRDQRHYWTREWQQGEDEADAELRRGEGVTFDNTEDAFRWLESPED